MLKRAEGANLLDNAMVKELARAFRWRKMLDTGVHATLEDLARAKGIATSYVSRILRLTLLAPEVVEAILDGRQPEGMRLDELLEGSRWSGTDSGSTPVDRPDFVRKRIGRRLPPTAPRWAVTKLKPSYSGSTRPWPGCALRAIGGQRG
jgi:hypothetical protein